MNILGIKWGIVIVPMLLMGYSVTDSLWVAAIWMCVGAALAGWFMERSAKRLHDSAMAIFEYCQRESDHDQTHQ